MSEIFANFEQMFILPKLLTMAVEIERKYLVKSDEWRSMSSSSSHFCQFYLSVNPDCTVRIRIIDDSSAFLTVKSRNKGISRGEWEYPIPVEDARAMMELHVGRLVIKRRHIVPFGGYIWEVDIFEGELSGLAVAEVELPSSDAVVALPPFVGKEVSGDVRYYNSSLSGTGALPPEVSSLV